MKRLILLICLFSAGSTIAQTLKPEVLVVGGSAAGVAAAIQAARSGVKTLLIEPSARLGNDISPVTLRFEGGMWQELTKRIKESKNDTLAIPDPETSARVLKSLTDTVKNLTVRFNATFEKIEKSGKGWEVKLSGEKVTIKSRVVIDATADEKLATAAGIPTDPATHFHNTILPAGWNTGIYKNLAYRTSSGVGYEPKTGLPFVLPIGSLLTAGSDNFLVIGKIAHLLSAADAMNSGQAAGACAAFFAFFDETTKSLTQTMRIREIQAELLKFNARLMPYTDIKRADPEYDIFQRIGLTGILSGRSSGTEFRFDPDSAVSLAEVRAPIKALYSRSQIWLADKTIDKFTTADLISLIKYVASKGSNLDKEMERDWNGSLYLTGKFDPAHVLTRREFAVLVDTYLKPFDIRIDLNGKTGS